MIASLRRRHAGRVVVFAMAVRVLGCAIALGCACLVSPASAAPRATAPLDEARRADIRRAMQKLVDEQQIAGAVTVVGRRGGDPIGALDAVGFADVEAKRPMKADTVFRIASMTKVITAVAVALLEADGKLDVSDPVERHLPEFRGLELVGKRDGNTITLTAPPRKLTIADLLTHTSGMRCSPPPGFTELYREKNRPLAEGVLAFSQQPLETAQGTKWRYCSTAFDTAGRIVEVVAGKPFERFLEERLFKPLGMKNTTFRPSRAERARLATLYERDKSNDPAKESGPGPDEPSGRIVRAGNQGVPGPPDGKPTVYVSPSGGLYSTAPDYARFLQMLLDGGRVRGRVILNPETLAKFVRVHFTSSEKVGFSPGLGMGLGVQVVMTPTGVSEALAKGSYGHGGAYGTQAWVDAENGSFYLLMIQRQGFGNGDQAEVRRTFQRLAAPTTAVSAPAPPSR